MAGPKLSAEPRADGRSAASFRDPAGFVFERHGVIYRQVNRAYAPHYDHLMASGLARNLIERELLISHEEVDVAPWSPPRADRVLRPERVPFVSYPYEWSFGQCRDAALLTLEVQERALDAGMSLKDASAYNVQFRAARPIFIDTLSFERYREGAPWVAYRQFCEHFLAPLALGSLVDWTLLRLLRTHLDGIPLSLAGRLLPRRAWINPDLLIHIHLHSTLQHRFANQPGRRPPRPFTERSLRHLIASLRSGIEKLRWTPPRQGWSEYTRDHNYSDAAFFHKRRIVEELLDQMGRGVAWDLGANTGEFSRIAARLGFDAVAFDGDPACVETCYRHAVAEGELRPLPLVMDLVNPSPALGWQHKERLSLLERGPADVVLALALVHHLAITHNLPFSHIAEFLHACGRALIIEFVPPSDSQTQRLAAGRDDALDGYDRAGFEAAFRRRFTIERVEPIAESDRVVYLMRRSNPS